MLSLIVTSTRPWFSSVTAWAKPSTASTRAPASRATSAPSCWSCSALHLALQIGERRDRIVVGPRDDDALADRIRLGQIVFLLPLRRDRDLVGDDVEPVGLQRGEDRIPRCLNEFDVDAELLADRAGDVDVVAGQLAGGGIVVAERRVDTLGADAQHASRFHRVVAVACRRSTCREHAARRAAARRGRFFVDSAPADASKSTPADKGFCSEPAGIYPSSGRLTPHRERPCLSGDTPQMHVQKRSLAQD